MAEYDLTATISSYFDPHLVVPLLEYISAKNIYDSDTLLKTRLELLRHTSMIDFEAETYQQLHKTKDLPAEFADRRSKTMERLQVVKNKMRPVEQIFNSETLKDMCKTDNVKDLMQTLETKHNFTQQMLDDIFEAAMVFYDSSLYNRAAEYLRIVRQLVGMDDARYLHSCWGILACEILVQNTEEAMQEVDKLKAAIDHQSEERPSPRAYLVQLQQRTWMLHWSLLVFFNHVQGKEKLIEWFLTDANHMNAIQTLCPHLLRYLAVCVVVNQDRKKKSQIKELVRLIQQESYSYKDPITEFLECLYIKFDFDGAQEKLRTCEGVLFNDFFLTACFDDFLENARLLMFETFCRIHHCVGIEMLSERLNMTVDDAETWIVNLIRNARMDAKIDSEKGLIIMGMQTMSPYEQVIERTRDKAFVASRLLLRLNNKERGLQ